MASCSALHASASRPSLLVRCFGGMALSKAFMVVRALKAWLVDDTISENHDAWRSNEHLGIVTETFHRCMPSKTLARHRMPFAEG